MAKALGSGVVQGTMAVGSGVVQGTMAVGSGVVQGSIAGVVQGSKVVGTGVVQGTLVASRMTKDVTIAVGKGVYHASEVVGNAAVTGVSAASEATVSASRVVTNASVSAVKDTTKWVKEQSESFGYEDHNMYTVLPGDLLEELAAKNNVSAHDIIRINHLQRRLLIPGKLIMIPDGSDQIEPHPDEILVAKAFLVKANSDKKEEALVKITTAKFSVTSNMNCILDCVSDQVSKLTLDVAVNCVPDLLPAHSLNLNKSCDLISDQNPSQDDQQLLPKHQQCHIFELSVGTDLTINEMDQQNDEIKVTLELFLTKSKSAENEEIEEITTMKFMFPQGDLSSIYAYLALWHPEKLDISDEIQKYLILESSGLANCDDSGPVILDKSSILDERNIIEIYRSLPHKIQNQAWSLAYSTRLNGFSLQNFYRTLSEYTDSTLIIIQDNNGYVFGAYLSCTPRVSETFIGTGKSWLFTFGRVSKERGSKAIVEKDDENKERSGLFLTHKNTLSIFHWSGLNEYFFRGTIDNMIFGAGNGKFGIFIDSDLHKGRIQDCETFERWAHMELDFSISCLECWRFV